MTSGQFYYQYKAYWLVGLSLYFSQFYLRVKCLFTTQWFLNVSEPNNESPLNMHAAEMWENQSLYKKVLLEKYDKEVRCKQQ